MADYTYYINTNSTAGGDGTTNATAGANRAFASSAEATSNSMGGHKALTGSDRLIINFCGTVADTSQFIVTSGTGFSFSNTSALVLQAHPTDPAGFCSDGSIAYSTNHYRIENNYAPIYISPTAFNPNTIVYIDGLQIYSIGGNSEYLYSNMRTRYTRCRIKGDVYALVSDGTYSILEAWNNLIFGGGSNAAILLAGGTDGGVPNRIINNTISCTGTRTAISASGAGTHNISNNAIDTSTSLSGTTTRDYNAYNSGQGSETHGLVIADWTTQFNNRASLDFRLKSGATMRGAGIGPTGDANTPTTDLLGNARSGATTDIGALMYVAAPVTGRYSMPIIT